MKPDRLAERIDEAFSEPEPRRALLVMTQLQLETVSLAPDGPNVNRARRWLAAGLRCGWTAAAREIRGERSILGQIDRGRTSAAGTADGGGAAAGRARIGVR